MKTDFDTEYSNMVSKLAKPGADIIKELTPESIHILHMAVGLCGEVGELINAIEEDDQENVLEELGDIEFYFEGIKQTFDCEIPNQNFVYNFDMHEARTNLIVNACDILDLAKKQAIYCKDESKQLLTECHEFRNILTNIYKLCGIAPSFAKVENRRKLSLRYGQEYSNKGAQERKDKNE